MAPAPNVDISSKLWYKWVKDTLESNFTSLDDFADGTLLCQLVERCLSQSIRYNKKPRLRLQKMENLTKVLDLVAKTLDIQYEYTPFLLFESEKARDSFISFLFDIYGHKKIVSQPELPILDYVNSDLPTSGKDKVEISLPITDNPDHQLQWVKKFISINAIDELSSKTALLCELLIAISGEPFRYSKRPKMCVHHHENISICIKNAKKLGIDVPETVSARSILDGNIDTIQLFLSSLEDFPQSKTVQDNTNMDEVKFSSAPESEPDLDSTSGPLLQWANNFISINAIDELSSKSALLCELLIAISGEPFRYSKRPRMRIHHLENISNCIKKAKKYGINVPDVVTVESIMDGNIIAIENLLSSFRHFHFSQTHQGESLPPTKT